MERKLLCPGCGGEYSEMRVPRLIPTCGHTLCEGCIAQRIEEEGGEIEIVCGQDGGRTVLEDRDIRNFPKNFALLKMVSRIKAEKEKENEKEIILKTKEKQNTPPTQKSIKTLSTPTPPPQPSPDLLSLSNLCLIHSKPLQIICIQDKTKICSSCAIFGQHKNHDFKTIDQFQKDKLHRCDAILQILESKQKTQQSLKTQLSKPLINEKIKEKKDSILQEIKGKYERLAECLRLSEKKVVNKIGVLFKTIEDRLEETLKYPEEVFDKYTEWEISAYADIQIFQSSDVEDQIRVLNYTNSQNDTLITGDKILAEMVEECTNLTIRRNKILDSCQVDYKGDMDLRIMDYCSVNLKEQSQVKKQIQQLPRLSEPRAININVIPPIPIETKMIGESLLIKYVEKPTAYHYLPQSHRSNIEKVTYLLDQPAEDCLLEEFTKPDQTTDKYNNFVIGSANNCNSRVNYMHQQSFQHISSIDNMSRGTSRQMSIVSNLQTSFLRNSIISGAKSPSHLPPPKRPSNNKPATTRTRKLKLLPDKYHKVYQGILSDTLDVVDLTGGELGDSLILQIMQSLEGKKCKTVKLIRNKITDECLGKLWKYFENVITLNLSQNLLTERCIESLLQNLGRLKSLRSVILSQNKIKERLVKVRVEEIKKQDIIISL